MEQQPRAGQVLQEAQPQASTVGGTFNQPRYVGHYKVLMHPQLHHAQVWHQGGERVVGHFGLGRRDRTNQRRLTGVGHAQQAHIRHHFHFQAQVTTVAFGARRGAPRRAVGRGFEVNVTQATTTTGRHQHDLPDLGHIGNHLKGVFINHRGAYRHFYVQVFTSFTAHLAAHAALPIFSFVETLKFEINQGVERIITNQINAATVAAITTIGATLGHIFLAAKAQTAIAAFTCLNNNRGFIDELHWILPAASAALTALSPPALCGKKGSKRQKSPAMAGLFFRHLRTA